MEENAASTATIVRDKRKYKDNSTLQAQETMKKEQKHGTSPLGGCLPTMIQIPVWFALYNVMLYSVELYDSSFLYLKDLTSVDPYGVLPLLYRVNGHSNENDTNVLSCRSRQ